MTTATADAFAGAKVNLTLRVTARRPNGYHDLDSLVVHSTNIGDVVRVDVADTTTLTITGPFADGLSTTDNLVLSAAEAMQRRGAPHVRMTLDKQLPVASGIGGGSADAAAALHAINTLLPEPLPPAMLQDIGGALGADVPMCLDPRPMRVTGTGDILTSVDCPALHLVLVNPGVALSTKAVFGALQQYRAASPAFDPDQLHAWIAAAGNDLLEPARALAPEIDIVLQALRDAPASGLSGSGATCFAMFDTLDKANETAAALSATHPEWWCRAAVTRGTRP